MMNLNLFLLMLLALLLLVAVQIISNIQMEKRYQQVWLPVVAVIFMFSVIRFDHVFLNIMTKYVFEIFPVLKDYSLISFNLIILAVFVMTKGIWKNSILARNFFDGKKRKLKVPFLSTVFHKLFILLPKKIGKAVTKKDQSVFIVYQKTNRGIRLKPEWSFAKKLFKITSYLAFILVFTQLFLASFHLFPSLLEVFPKYPILSYLILAELTWFLGGLLPTNSTEKIDGNNVISITIAQYDALYDEYERLWPNRLLTNGKIQEGHNVKEFNYEKIAINPEIQARVNQICSRLKCEGVKIDGNYASILTNILEEDDVLIEDPSYQELANYLFPAIYGLLSKNKKLLVITPNNAAAKDAVGWFQKGIHKASGLDFAWTVATFQDAIEQNLDADILVLSPNYLLQDSLYQFLNKYKNTGYIEGIIFLEAEKIFTEYGLLIHLFNTKLQSILKKKPQYIVMSQWYADLEHSVRELLHSVPKDTLGSLPKSEQLYYMVWKTEGEEAFQTRILNKMIHRRLDPEAILALPAIKYGIESLHNVFQMKNATFESFEELLDNRVHLKKYGIADYQIDLLKNNIHFYYQNWNVPVSDFSFIVARDYNHNLVDTLMQWNSVGKEACFVHIISPDYLLRDYLASNLEYFLDNNRKFAPVSARVSNTTWRKAFLLVEKLSTDYMSEEEITKELKQLVQVDDTVLETINKLFKQTFKVNCDFTHVLYIKNEEHFDKNKQSFVNVTNYYLPTKAKQEIFPAWFRFFTIKTITGAILDQVLEGHVYQNYIVGQFHAFNGLLYQIKNIDKTRGEIEVAFEAPIGELSYRQSREYHLNLLDGLSTQINKTIPVLVNGYEVRKCLVELELEVITKGYFSFSRGKNLMDETTNITLFNDIGKDETKRHYQNGNALMVKLSSINNQILYPNEVAFTLSFLLNEIFPTLFPQTHQYLAACTHLPEEYFDESPFLERLKLYSPQIFNVRTTNTKDSIYLYIMEDSELHMGLLESILEKWDHILEILADYLEWVREQMVEGYEPFFFLGNKHLPKCFDLSNTTMLINHLTPKNDLKGLRTKKDLNQEIVEMDTVECDFCGNSFPIAEREMLDDLRDRCFLCRATGVDTVDELVPLYDLVKEFFDLDLDLTIDKDINVMLLNAKEIQAEAGKTFIPTDFLDVRVIGLAIKHNEDQFSILIENGAPKTQTLGTLVHELTHIWQYEHLKIENMDIKEIEGLAVWTEIYYLEKMGERIYAEKLKEQMTRRNDEYGIGYRQLMEILKEQPEGTTPFELYRKKVRVYK
jgi:hypothetical protein